MTSEPYASARRVFWIVDNGSSHHGAASITRMSRAWPNAHVIHLPAHASWPDQAEIYFSIVQRKALKPNSFTSLDQIRHRLAAFEVRYNAIATPFDWRFSRTDHPLMAALQRDGRLLASPGQRVERWCEDDHHWTASYHPRQRGIFGLKVIYGDPFNVWEKRPQKGVELTL
jgi:DDE superfamily endonuclease